MKMRRERNKKLFFNNNWLDLFASLPLGASWSIGFAFPISHIICLSNDYTNQSLKTDSIIKALFKVL